MTVRFAFSLGLHIRNEDQTATAVKKEILSRMWWAIFTLDRTLSAITGRPSVGAEIYCSTTLPLPIAAEDINEATIEAKFGPSPRWASVPAASSSEASSSRSSTVPPGSVSESANSGSFLKSTVALGLVSNRVLSQLYSPNLVTKSWKEVQKSIAALLEELDAWLSGLPKGLNPFKETGPEMEQERNMLRTYYHSTKILICRPCLCRLDRRIQSQTQSSDDFNHKIATECVASARAIAARLPSDVPTYSKDIYTIFPWWASVHYVMQSIAILLLEACYEAEEMDIMPALRHLVRWLKVMKPSNAIASRAYSITLDLLNKMKVRHFKDPNIARVRSMRGIVHSPRGILLTALYRRLPISSPSTLKNTTQAHMALLRSGIQAKSSLNNIPWTKVTPTPLHQP